MPIGLGTISFFLARPSTTFETALRSHSRLKDYQERSFKVKNANVRFYFFATEKRTSNPPWLDFANEQLTDQPIQFSGHSKRANGLLLIQLGNNILAACFGIGGASLLNKTMFLPDFGIKTAMNMCGNQELRQTKSRTHSLNTQQIDRQISIPTDSSSFGLSETEFLKYISAHVEDRRHITLQGKDSLSIKINDEEKLSWDNVLDYAEDFIKQYKGKRYKKEFPNYFNLQPVTEEKADELDSLLLKKLKKKNFELIHLAIPDFIEDDEYSFAYTNYAKKNNAIHSHLRVEHLDEIFDLAELEIKKLKSNDVYAYSHAEEQVLDHKSWPLYTCIIAEIKLSSEYFILSEGVWQKVENDFYKSIEDYIKNVLIEEPVPKKYHNINIAVMDEKKNKEAVFNRMYATSNPNALVFDQAKLRVGQGKKDKEFCDILEIGEGSASIIQVKQLSGTSSINYLFSQTRFYCESFISDETFLKEIRAFISDSTHPLKAKFLKHIKEKLKDVEGSDYQVKLWLLYCDKSTKIPTKIDLPLMAKYELKLAHEKLTNLHKYNSVCVSFIPVKRANFKSEDNKKTA